MTYFVWKPAFDLGHKKINSEHQNLIQLMNQLFEKNAAKAPHDSIASTLKELADYTIFHFAEEEAYMTSVKFPGLEVHKVIHKNLLDKLAAHRKEFEQQRQGLAPEFFQFLSLWLSSHIQGIDKQYSDFAGLGVKKAG